MPKSGTWRGTTYSFEQKFSRGFQRHLVKAGFRFMRETGGRLNPEIPKFRYNNYADLLANIPFEQNTSYGAPPHASKMDNYSAFIQDDWRLGGSFVLNLGLRYDYYGTVEVTPTTPVAVEIVNYENPTDLTKLDFGPLRDPLKPYDPDSFNLGPRAGFAWTLNDAESTVVRGGVGYLYSPNLIATVRQSAANPFIPFRIVYNRTEIDGQEREVADVHRRHGAVSRCETQPVSGPCSRSSTPTCRCHTRFSRCSACSIPSAARWRRKSGYVRTDGNDFPLQRQFTQAVDRQLGRGRIRVSARRAAITSTAARRWITTACRLRCGSVSRTDTRGIVNYTLGKSESTQGGDLSAYYIASVREQPGLLGSRIRPWAVQQRHPASAQRVVHLRAAAIRRRRYERRAWRLADSPASSRRDLGMRYWSRSPRESTEADLMSSRAWI